MRRVVHGLSVDVSGTLPEGVVEEVLGGFPRGDAALPMDLAIVLERRGKELRPGLKPLFYYGAMRAYEGDGDLWLTYGGSTARVSGDGRTIEVFVGAGPKTKLERHLFLHLFFMTALVRALSCFGMHHLHAAGLVLEDGRTVLVSGTGGSGKSTIALALIEAGLSYLSDDVVLLREREGEPVVLGFPKLFHVSPEVLRGYPRLEEFSREFYGAGEKRNLDARLAFPGKERFLGASPVAVLLPEVADIERTEMRQVEGAEALVGLLDGSAFLGAEREEVLKARMALLAKVANSATAVRVRLGRDALRDPVTLAKALMERLVDLGHPLRG